MGAQGRWAFLLLLVWNIGGRAHILIQRHVGAGEPSAVAGRSSKRAGPGFLGSFNSSAAWRGPRDSLRCPTTVQQVTKGCWEPVAVRAPVWPGMKQKSHQT